MDSINAIVDATLNSWEQVFKFVSSKYNVEYNDLVNSWVSHIGYKPEFTFKSKSFNVSGEVVEKKVVDDKCSVVQKNGKVCGKNIKSDGVCALHLKTKPVKTEKVDKPEESDHEEEPPVVETKTKKTKKEEPVVETKEEEPPVAETKKSKTKETKKEEPPVAETKKSKSKKEEPPVVETKETKKSKSKETKKEEPPVVETKETKKSKSKKEEPVASKKDEPKKLQLKRYTDNMWIHEETSFIFNKEDKMVVGKLVNNKVVDLTIEDIELCNKWKFKYVEPKKIINNNDKPSGESDDEEEDSDVSSSEEEEESEEESDEEESEEEED